MDTHTAPRPTGLRQISIPQFQAEAAGAVPFTPASPGRMLAAFKRAAPALGIARRVVDLIDYLMGHSRPQDWESSPGPIVWPSDAELEDRLCVGPSQRKVLLRAALDGGFVRLRRSPTGRRWGHRKGSGNKASIVEAFGFDLMPLAERMEEFECLAAEWEARRAEGKRLRREITSSRNHILSLVDLALTQNLEGEDWPAVAMQANALWHGRGIQRDPLPLIPIAARLRALSILVQEKMVVALAGVESGETNPAGPKNRPHLITTIQPFTANADTTSDFEAGLSRPTAGNKESSDGLPDQQAVTRGVRVGPTRESPLQMDALRGFVVTPSFLLAVTPIFRDWVSTAEPGWDELEQAANGVRSALGISPQAWGQAYLVLGPQAAVAALAAICARHAIGKVKSPGGLLRRMVELHHKGELRLDKTMFGLADKLKKQQASVSGLSDQAANPVAASRSQSVLSPGRLV